MSFLRTIKSSLSGWEKSHFGGFYRMVQDYPFIKFSYDVQIELHPDLLKNLGVYMGEKLIKMYLVKLNNHKLYQQLIKRYEIVEPPKDDASFKFIQTPAYMVVRLNNDHGYSMGRVLDIEQEFAPLFEHYKDAILGSLIKIPIEDDSKGDGDGDGKGEGEEGEKGEEGEGKSESKEATEGKTAEEKALEKIKEALANIKEWSPLKTSLASYDGDVQFVNFEKKGKTYKFEEKEIKDAEHLVKLLDISFEPKEDIVKSLRTGKLDVSKIAEVPAGNTSIYKQIVEDVDTRPFTVCILADMSGSMTDGVKSHMQRHTLNSLYLALRQIVPEDKLFIYGHTGDDVAEIYTFYSPYDQDFEANMAQYFSIDWCENYDGPVIEAIHKKVRSITDDRVIFISLSDGSPAGNNYGSEEDVEDMKRIIERARRDDFVTVGIGMKYSGVKGVYTYTHVVHDMSLMVKEVSHTINSVVRAEFK